MNAALPDQLMDAIWREDLSRVQQLLDSGADVNATGSKGLTPLTLAAETGNVSIARLLLDRGADVNGRAYRGCTPIHLAVDVAIEAAIQSGGQPGDEPTELIELLLERGASLLVTDDAGNTPGTFAARSQKILKIFVPWMKQQKSQPAASANGGPS